MKDYFKENKLVMLIVISALVMGIIVGASIVSRVTPDEAKEIYTCINRSVSENTVYKSFVKSLEIEFRSFLILFVCGVAVIGAPAAVFYIGVLGYAIGFTVGFLIKYYGLTGLFASLCAIVPHYLLLLPAFMCMGIVGINFSSRLLLGEKNLRDSFGTYLVKALLIAVIVLAACLVEGFLSSFVLKKILSIVSAT